ncbi:MAG: 6-phosphogluconolactonase [Actinomycetota bacterium]
MSFKTDVFGAADYSNGASARIAEALAGARSLVLTGGTNPEKVYPQLAGADVAWRELAILFSDERCVPPTDPASNFLLAERLLLERVKPRAVHRMKGEETPAQSADQYHDEIEPLVKDGLDVILLGMGADAHIGAMFPGSVAIDERDRLCVVVDRPDGMQGLTLTPPAMLSGKRIFLLVTGEGKAETVARVVNGSESPSSCPARMLADHPDVTFLLDEGAASLL